GVFYESIMEKCITKMKKNKDSISQCLNMVIGNEELWRSYQENNNERMKKYNIRIRTKLAYFLNKYLNIKKFLPVNLRDVPKKIVEKEEYDMQDDMKDLPFFIRFKKEFLVLSDGVLP